MNTPNALQIELDGRPHAVAPGTTLAALLDSLDAVAPSSASVASAVNGTFVARAQRAHTVLAQGDAVVLFRAIVGG